MNERLKAKMDQAASLLNDDGSVTPAPNLPARLLVEEGPGGMVADVQAALVTDTVAHALKLARQQTEISARELAQRRNLPRGGSRSWRTAP